MAKNNNKYAAPAVDIKSSTSFSYSKNNVALSFSLLTDDAGVQAKTFLEFLKLAVQDVEELIKEIDKKNE